jgi:hypothetical protein
VAAVLRLVCELHYRLASLLVADGLAAGRRDYLKGLRTWIASVDLTCQITGERIVKEDAEGSADNGVMNGAAIHCVEIGIVEDVRILLLGCLESGWIMDLRVEIGGHDTAPGSAGAIVIILVWPVCVILEPLSGGADTGVSKIALAAIHSIKLCVR